ncbi:hypothetical protein SK128_010727 [Halocaridina rubra]|uniref:Uncharacterized protein n=1 Tax=Halocaridina rubra TaxID=373956 RepID=A0AAN8WKY9_HALRR
MCNVFILIHYNVQNLIRKREEEELQLSPGENAFSSLMIVHRFPKFTQHTQEARTGHQSKVERR